MYPKRLESYIIYEDEDIYKAHWKLHKNKSILIVVDSSDKYKGVITFKDIEKSYDNSSLTIKEICNLQGKFLNDSVDNLYMYARNLFIEYPYVRHIPVIDNEKNLVDILSRERVFWKQYYQENRLPRMHYAYVMWNAALEAKALGYDSFSVAEFGVAGGNGLVNCEFHAKEIKKILGGVNIDIYGFDSSNGLPMNNLGHKDIIHGFPGGSFHMDVSALQDRLEQSTLVIGDIRETLADFSKKYNPAPIGCMLIDVDYYSSTVPILKFLEKGDGLFLPRIYMYFDDIWPEYEFSGELLAIKEFNESHEKIKISPEKFSEPDYRYRTKICHRFMHKDYNKLAPVFCGWETTPDIFELRLKESL